METKSSHAPQITGGETQFHPETLLETAQSRTAADGEEEHSSPLHCEGFRIPSARRRIIGNGCVNLQRKSRSLDFPGVIR